MWALMPVKVKTPEQIAHSKAYSQGYKDGWADAIKHAQIEARFKEEYAVGAPDA